MNYRQLGRSGIKVSELCLGTMNFGPRCSEKESFAILNEAVEAGINFIDTANQYGGELGVGISEKIIGKWLAQDNRRRERLIIATKVHEPMSKDINDRGLSARHIQMACDASLKRLGVDHIDLYQMHHIDRETPIEETWQAMERLIAQGKITYVGSSNFPGWAIAQAQEKAIARNKLGLVAEQSLYNLTQRQIELEVLPACREYGLGFIPWSPLAGGLLAGPSSMSSGRRQSKPMQVEKVKHAKQLKQFQDLCDDLNEPTSAIALAWLLHQPGLSSTIVGPAHTLQLRNLLKVPHISLSDETLMQIDRIFPPCGTAPEAYAW